MADQALGLLASRKKLHQQRRATIIGILGEGALRQMLAEGVAPGVALSERTRRRCRDAAQAEAEAIAGLMESVPIGIQLGLFAGPDPVGSFLVLRGRERAHVVGNPFPPDAAPGGAPGVGMITAAEEAVTIHQRVAEAAWRDALKGAAAAERVRALIREAEAAG